MPGTGGNFLSRVCEQSHCRQMIQLAQYPEWQYSDHRDPGSTSWINYERTWTFRPGTRNYIHGHVEATRNYMCDMSKHPNGSHVWLRVTVTDLEEWRWAVCNAFWKNSDPFKADGCDYPACSDPARPAQHYLSLRHMWHWPWLSMRLSAIGLGINPHMQELWQQWRRTWSPRSALQEWHLECRERWDTLRPAHVI